MDTMTRWYFTCFAAAGSLLGLMAVAEYAVVPMMVSSGFVRDVVAPAIATAWVGF